MTSTQVPVPEWIIGGVRAFFCSTLLYEFDALWTEAAPSLFLQSYFDGSMQPRTVLPLFLLLLLMGCVSDGSRSPEANNEPPSAAPDTPRPVGPQSDDFGDYWYQGEAELTSYDLQQARYGEIHDGRAVLIFVTEPFSKSKHVKVDDASEAGDDAANVLKLNHTRKFNTGIYPYSMMTSIFTPVKRQSLPHTLKVTSSAQEWCGHAFMQFNRTEEGYRTQRFSYFESIGDRTGSVSEAMLEDEVWTTIRLNPDDLPIGTLQMVPGTQYLRLSHVETRPYEVEATLRTTNDSVMTYSVDYSELARSLTIRFKSDFPHEIEGWTETHLSGFGPDADTLTTKATRRAHTMQPYWEQNAVADEPLREELLDLGQ